jgi:hypothetical protein
MGLLLAIGSVYGIARCQIYDGFTHFLFDAAVLGAYLGGVRCLRTGLASARLKTWIVALAILPVFLILLSPMLDAQPFLVQLLGIRPALLFLPLVLFGAAMEIKDFRALALWAAPVTMAAGIVAVGEYVWGLESFFPVNEASKIIYLSQDVGEGAYRIPSTFSSAHAYGGTMLALLPLLAYLVEEGGWRQKLGITAAGMAILGIFACGARTPVIGLAFLAVVMGLRGLRSPNLRAAMIAIGIIGVLVVPRESRLQRYETLSDTDYVRSRVAGSVNVGLIDTIVDYPFGRGLASAVGTSIPFFLIDEARPQVGLESEYARIAVEQGLIGVLLWVGFAGYVLLRNPFKVHRLGGPPDTGMWAVSVFSWILGLIGTGMLASVPGTLLLFTYMGAVVTSANEKESVRDAVRHTQSFGEAPVG